MDFPDGLDDAVLVLGEVEDGLDGHLLSCAHALGLAHRAEAAFAKYLFQLVIIIRDFFPNGWQPHLVNLVLVLN